MGNIKETFYLKLIRDKVPDLLRMRGVHSDTKVIEGAEYALALERKLHEIATEYLFSKDSGTKIEELTDLLEAIHAILALRGISFDELEERRKSKLEEKGGFSKGILLKKTVTEFPLDLSLPSCVFCQIATQAIEAEIIARFAHCYVIKDHFPVSKGHLLIIPYKHIVNWFDADEEVRIDIVHALEAMKAFLDNEYHPDGYNFGANCGEAAGQTVMHLHVHLIPRYRGDTLHPRGGVRGVIPSKQSY